jgi:hypothetical protein
MLTVKRHMKMMTNKYRFLFKKIDDRVITLKLKLKIDLFLFLLKTQQFMIYRIVTFLWPLTVYQDEEFCLKMFQNVLELFQAAQRKVPRYPQPDRRKHGSR